MAVRITNRAKKSIRNLYWRSTIKSIQRNAETKSLVDAMVELVNSTPLAPSKENRGVLGIWRSKGYVIYESTHCFVRYANGIGCKPMTAHKTMKRKWYFACIRDVTKDIVYIVNAVFARYIDRMSDNTPTAFKFLSAMKGLETKRRKKEAQQLQIPFTESYHNLSQKLLNEDYLLKRINLIVSETIHKHLHRKRLRQCNK